MAATEIGAVEETGLSGVRVGVLDVGSNSAHLRIADLKPGEPPRVVGSVKHPTRLAGTSDAGGALGAVAVDRLMAAVRHTASAAYDAGVEELLAFATATVRDATNRHKIVARVEAARPSPWGSYPVRSRHG